MGARTGPHIIEPIAARGWPAKESAELGAWRLYASDGQSGRLNTCWTLGAADRPVDAAIAAVGAWYAERGLAPRFKLIDGAAGSADLTERLAARGYRTHTPTLTMLGPLEGKVDAAAELLDQPNDDFAVVFADPTFGDAADAAERLGALGRIRAPRGFALLRVEGAPAAVGTCVVDGAWAGILGMRTAPQFRRQGLARRLFRTLTAFAREAGARRGYLQVDESNATAISLYESEGFVGSYLYRYWVKD